MASFSGGGGGFGGPRGLPQGVTQAQLDEIKSFNAGLTQAGNKSRPPRSRGSGLNHGLGSGISPGRGGSYSASSTPRSGSGAGYGGGASYSVGPSTPLPITKPTAREAAPTHLRGRVDVSKTRWANLDDSGAGTLGSHTIGPLNSAATPSKSRSRSPTRNSILTTQRPLPSPPKLQEQRAPTFQPLQNVDQGQVTQYPQPSPPTFQQQQGPVFQTSQNVEPGQNSVSRIPTPPGRVRIVTNWTPDDPSKPFIPAHLRQDSCRKALEDISKMTGRPYFEITSDGMSIPAHPSHLTNITIPRSTFAPVPVHRQADVDQHNTSMTNNTANAQPMLFMSRWAPAADTAQLNGFASAFSATPAPTAPTNPGWGATSQGPQHQPAQGRPSTQHLRWGVASTAPVVNIQPSQSQSSGWGASVQQTAFQSQPTPAENGGGWDTAGTTRWAQLQLDAGSGSGTMTPATGFGSGPVPPSNTGDFSNTTPTQGGFGWGTVPTAPVQKAQAASGWGQQTIAAAQPIPASNGGWDSGVPAHNPDTLAPSSGHTRIPSQSMSDVEMTGNISLLDTPVGDLNLSNDPMNQVLNAMPSLADSQWATQSWNSPNAPATASNRPFETGRQPLSETAPGGFSYINTQINQTHATPGNGWPNSTVPPQAQSFAAPFNVAEFNNRVTQELLQTTRSGSTPAQPAQPAQPLQPVQRPQPAGYGPPHLQNAPHGVNRTILGRPTENAPPKKGDKVQYLKDSRWAH